MHQWVLSVPFPLRFLFASQPKVMGKALGIVNRTIATHLTRKAGYSKTTAHTGAVTLIQRFGSALNLNIHFQWRRKRRGYQGHSYLTVERHHSRACSDSPKGNLV
jgi:hypothetical protein